MATTWASEKPPPPISWNGISRVTPLWAFTGGNIRSTVNRAFALPVESAGHQVDLYDPPTTPADRAWEVEIERLAAWIRGLPKPIGIMACNDDRGREVLEACRLSGANVPEEVAVVGVDNDQLWCDLADPPLTSVAFNAKMGGYQCADALAKMMETGVQQPQVITINVLNVVTRRSTDAIAVDDPDIANALAFIRNAMGRDIDVDDVAEQTLMSRRSLETRFKEVTGRTILAEIQKSRLDHAKLLLEETDYPVPKVARLAGYSSAGYLIQVFRKYLNVTPAKYRASKRGIAKDEAHTPFMS